MRSPLLLMSILIGALLPPAPGSSRADDSSPDGPQHVFQDPFNQNLVGRWHITRKIRGTQVENTLQADWVLNHQFLQLHMKDVARPSQYEALVLIGYSYGDRQYVAHWCDTFGGKFSAIGHGKRLGESIAFEFHYPDGPFYNTFTWNASNGTWVFRMESVDKDGGRVLFGEDTLRRR